MRDYAAETLIEAVRKADADLRDLPQSGHVSVEEDMRLFAGMEKVRIDLRAAVERFTEERAAAHTEWTYQMGGFIGAGICPSRESAESMVDDLRRQGWQVGRLVSRLVTPWRPDGTEEDA